MRRWALILLAMFIIGSAGAAVAEDYDAEKDYQCADEHSENWSYMAYREADGAFRELAYDRVPVTEMSKYGADAYYLPDGGQEYRPFFTRLADRLFCSPAYEGEPYSAATVWKATSAGSYDVSGEAVFTGKFGPAPPDGSVRVKLLVKGEVVFASRASKGSPAVFRHSVKLAEGEKVVLLVGNGEGTGPKVTEVSFKVSGRD